MAKYRQSLIDFTITGHHRANVNFQLRSQNIPDGLTVNVKSLIFNETEATQTVWKEAHPEFSLKLIQISLDHYVGLIER